jgi:hypothetical protein
VRAEQAKRKPADLQLSEVVEILCHTAPRPVAQSHAQSGPVPMELGNVTVAATSEAGPSDLMAVISQLQTQLSNLGVRGDRGRSPFGRGRSPSPHRDRPFSPGRSGGYGGGGHGYNRGYSPAGHRGYANTGRGYMPPAPRGRGFPARGGYNGGRGSRPPPDPRLHPSWPRGMIRSDAELNMLAAEGRCFCCKESGHSWLRCPTHVRRPNG